MKIEFKTPDEKSIVSYEYVETLEIVTLSGDKRSIDAWLLYLSRPQHDGCNRVFVPTSYQLVLADEELPFDPVADLDDDQDPELLMPSYLKGCHYASFVCWHKECDPLDLIGLLFGRGIPYAYADHSTCTVGNPHSHFLIDLDLVTVKERQDLYKELMLSNVYRVERVQNLAAQLCYMQQEGEFYNGLNKEEF